MFLKFLFYGLLLLLITHIAILIYHMDLHKHYFKHMPGTCKPVSGIDYGSEDFEVLSDGAVFISHGVSSDTAPASFKDFYKSKGIKGGIYLFNFNQPDLGAKEIPLKESLSFDPSTFQPHGLSVVEDKMKGQHLIFVVNHPRGGLDTIEKFRYIPESKELQHIETFSDPKFGILNDVAATGADSFYVTRMHHFRSENLLLLENFLMVKWGGVLFYNGHTFAEVVSGLRAANGITVSKDKRFVHVAAENSFYTYSCDAKGPLALVQAVDMATHLDNGVFSTDGKTLFTGCHPISYKIFQFFSDPRRKAPSQVLAIPVKDGKVNVDDVTELLYDHGELITGSSVAAVFKKKLLIGSVLDKLVLCDITTSY